MFFELPVNIYFRQLFNLFYNLKKHLLKNKKALSRIKKQFIAGSMVVPPVLLSLDINPNLF